METEIVFITYQSLKILKTNVIFANKHVGSFTCDGIPRQADTTKTSVNVDLFVICS